LSKPNKEIFEYSESKSDSSKLILCDDEKINIEVAESLGWQAIQIDHKSFGFSLLKKKLLDRDFPLTDNI